MAETLRKAGYQHVRSKQMEEIELTHFDTLKNALSKIEDSVSIQTQKGPFTVTPTYKDDYLIGVDVSNLRSYSFIPIEVFAVTLSLLYLCENHIAKNGNAMKGKLGDPDLPLNSVEGHIASVMYGKKNGDSVFRRITPVSKILEWAGVCEIGKGCLKLK